MQNLHDLHQKLIERIHLYEDEYRNNINAVKIQLVQPLLTQLGWDLSNPEVVKPDYAVGNYKVDYAFFDTGICVGFLLTTPNCSGNYLDAVKTICKKLQLDGGCVTDGLRWCFVDKNGYEWGFYTDEEGQDEKFLSHIKHINPHNIKRFGNDLELLVSTGQSNRLFYSWREFSRKKQLQELLKDLSQEFIDTAAYENQDIEFHDEELLAFFTARMVSEIKNSIPNSYLKVTMPDGKIIFHKEAKTVLLETIDYINIDKVEAEANFSVSSRKGKDGKLEPLLLIEQEPSGKTQHHVSYKEKTYYIYTGSNNKTKVEHLKKLRHCTGFSDMKVQQLFI